MSEIRDPIHGFVFRNPEEEKIIDTRIFQRLRGIRQLAMAHLVYPGAIHTRFDHSLGTLYVANRLLDQLKIRKKSDRKLVRLAALLHDIGHGPFSHTSEAILKRYTEKEKLVNTSTEEIHEVITQEIIRKHADIGNALGSEELRNDIVNLISKRSNNLLFREIVTGPLDADKQDYLLRDSYFCGVKYGVFDIGRLIGTLCSIPEPLDRIMGKSRSLVLAGTEESIYAIEQFVLAKYHMAKQVYFHRIRLITDSMIIRGIVLGIDHDGIDLLRELFTYDGTDSFIERYNEWYDGKLLDELSDAKKYKGTHVYEIFNRLACRKLFKGIYTLRIDKETVPTYDVHKKLRSLKKEEKEGGFQREIEKRIALFLREETGVKIKDHDVIVNVYDFKSVKESVDEGQILIKRKKRRKVKNFEEESALFKSIKEKEDEVYLDIYVPDDNNDIRKIERLESKITSIIKKEAKSLINKYQKGDQNVS